MNRKKGALELSMGTIVIVVLAMTMVILGLVLVRTIFSGATESVTDLNAEVREEIVNLFADEDDNVIVKLGSQKTAKIKPGSGNFGFVLGGRTSDGTSTDRSRLQYRLELNEEDNYCNAKLGVRQTEELFDTNFEEWNNFDEYEGDVAFALINVNIPKGTAYCMQKVYIDIKDTETGKEYGDFFVIDIVKGGIGGLFS